MNEYLSDMKKLHAGPVSVGYERGFLRRISYGDTEVVRMIYYALRDHNWNTLRHDIQNENIDIQDDRFSITYDCQQTDGGVEVMEWKVAIDGRADGTVLFEIRGHMLETFRKNRAGFCVLHPLAVSGDACEIEHADGSRSVKNFPEYVSPENPFKNVRSMRWTAKGIGFELHFEGDIFETEDQRNWGDASFKTFCTPLDRPFPVELQRGAEIRQKIVFTPSKRLAILPSSSKVVALSDTGVAQAFPYLGLGASTEQPRSTPEQAGLIRELRFHHCRIEVQPGTPDFAARFSEAYESAHEAGLPLEVALHVGDNRDEEIEAFTVISLQNRVRLRKVSLFSANGLVTGSALAQKAAALKKAFPKILVGGGTNHNFNELNKERFDTSGLDFITFAADPQEHAFDDMTILENAAALGHLVRSAKSIYGSSMPVHLSPLALLKRFNPYATNPADFIIPERKKADPRQKEVFCSVWTLASICSLATAGAQEITLFQTTGNQGVISASGEPYPVYDLLKRLSIHQGRPVIGLKSSDPNAVVGLLLDAKEIAMANLTEESRTVSFNSREYQLQARSVLVERLDRA